MGERFENENNANGVGANVIIDELSALGELRPALLALVLAPVEFEQLDEIENLQKACAILLVRVMARSKQIAESEIVRSLDDLKFQIGNRRAILPHETNRRVAFAMRLKPSPGSFFVVSLVGLAGAGDSLSPILFPEGGLISHDAEFGLNSIVLAIKRLPTRRTNLELKVASLKNILRSLASAAIFLHIPAALGQVFVWGNTQFGQTNVPALSTNIIALTGGDFHPLALLANRSVVSWGSNYAGQTNVPAAATNVFGIAAGSSHSLAVRGDGAVYLWGRIFSLVSNAPPEMTNAVAVAMGPGAQHAITLRADGTIWEWGAVAAYAGVLNNIPKSATNIVSVAAGSFHGVALRSDGKVFAWGDNSQGQLNVPASASNVVAIAAGWYSSAALRADGRVVTWGSMGSGRLLSGTNVVEIAYGGNHILTLRGDGRVFAIGQNEYGQSTVPTAATNIAVIGTTSHGSMAVVGQGPPIFPDRAVARTIASSETVFLRLRAVGAGTISYQWSFAGTNLPGETNLVLVVTNAIPSQSGIYFLTVSNAFGEVTNSEMVLSVLPLMITNQPFSVATNSGVTTTFRVGVAGQGPLSYQWQFNGTEIADATNSSLTLSNVQSTDSGTYTVTVSNVFGTVTSSPALLTVVPILITSQPQSDVAFPGAWVTFSVAAQSSQPLNYQWNFNGTPLPGATSTNLILTNVNYSQAGQYSVTLSNGVGQTNSVVVSFSVAPVAAWGLNLSGQTDVPPDLTNVVAIAAGLIHSLSLHTDGTVRAWGANASGESTVPNELTNAVAVSGGSTHSLALRSDGSILAWGSNVSGQTNVPASATNVVMISAGNNHNLALNANGTVKAWGNNGLGQTNVPPDLTNVVAISAGHNHNLALKQDGMVVAWGHNASGQTNVPAGLTNIIAIAGGSSHSLVLKADGTLASWGSSANGLLTIPVTATNILAIAAGNGFSAVLRQDGKLIVWGTETDGVTNIPVGLRNVSAISTRGRHILALVQEATSVQVFRRVNQWPPRDGAIQVAGGKSIQLTAAGPGLFPESYQWQFNGTNVAGGTNALLNLPNLRPDQAGNYSVVISNAFGVFPSATTFAQVLPAIIRTHPRSEVKLPGEDIAFVVDAETGVPSTFQWRFNNIDIPGAAGLTLFLTNLQVPHGGQYTLIISNEFGTIQSSSGLLSVNQIAPWGYSFSVSNSPAGLTNILAVAAGGSHNLALRADGHVVGWGQNIYGEATLPAGLSNVIGISAGNNHNLALLSNGIVAAWGINTYGQANLPDGLTNVVAVDAGYHHNLALLNSGIVVAWGEDTSGKTNVPPGLSGVVAIAAGYENSLALRSDGTVVAWGLVQPGETAGLSNVVAVAAGANHNVALKSDGTVTVWGTSSSILLNVPISATNVIAIGAGDGHSLALRADGTLITWGNFLYGAATNPPAAASNLVAISTGSFNSLALLGDGPPVVQAALINPTSDANGFSVSVPTQSGRVYRLEYKTSITDPDWTALPLAAGNGKVITLNDSTVPSNQTRFYRVRRW